jgi:hypothetical protein
VDLDIYPPQDRISNSSADQTIRAEKGDEELQPEGEKMMAAADDGYNSKLKIKKNPFRIEWIIFYSIQGL